MLHLLPRERPHPNAPRHYDNKSAGQRSDAEPHSPPPAGGLSPSSHGHSGRLGRCAEPAALGRNDAIPYAGAGTASVVPPHSGAGASGTVLRGKNTAARLAQFVLLALIRFYQVLLSPALPPACRFYPTCSEYAYEAVIRWGTRRGLWLALRRVVRCHPWGGHGCDPVPEKF